MRDEKRGMGRKSVVNSKGVGSCNAALKCLLQQSVYSNLCDVNQSYGEKEVIVF